MSRLNGRRAEEQIETTETGRGRSGAEDVRVAEQPRGLEESPTPQQASQTTLEASQTPEDGPNIALKTAREEQCVDATWATSLSTLSHPSTVGVQQRGLRGALLVPGGPHSSNSGPGPRVARTGAGVPAGYAHPRNPEIRCRHLAGAGPLKSTPFRWGDLSASGRSSTVLGPVNSLQPPGGRARRMISALRNYSTRRSPHVHIVP